MEHMLIIENLESVRLRLAMAANALRVQGSPVAAELTDLESEVNDAIADLEDE